MNFTVTNRNDVSRELEITATADELQPHFEKKYLEFRPKADIKGFRKGKAPLDIIKKLYGEAIEQESLEQIATDLYRQAVQEKELKPIGEPTLVDLDYKRGTSAMFRIRYDVRPQISVKKYKGIVVRRPVHTVTDSDVESEVLRLRRMNATTTPVQSVTDEEHIVTADMQDIDPSGMPLLGKRSQDVKFYLADEQLEQPFKDALKNAEKGGEHLVEFEHSHGDHTHSVRTRVTVKGIEKLDLPAFDDAFVATITKGKITGTADFLSGLRKDLEEYWKTKSERAGVNGLTSELLRMHDFEVPESLVRAVMEGLIKDVADQYPKKQLPANFDYDKFWNENKGYAEAQAKWALLREELIKAENIEVADEDLAVLAEREAPKINIDKERLLEYYKTSDQIRERLAGDKLVARLMSLATVEDVDDAAAAQEKKG